MFALAIAFFAASIPTLANNDSSDASSFLVTGLIIVGSSEFFLSISLLVLMPDALRINSSDECAFALIDSLSINEAFSLLKLST